ncbi:MAG TPA: protein kinase [Polyangiaceae bacterium]|jgi:serine/threonine-protein kinase|nr:protein kinase [Polyangiaceae bacterium]
MSHQQQRYKVLERIAAGGMAEVYRAESAGLEGFKKTVAIKRVLPHLAEKKQFIGMFLDEARLSAHLNHSNCVHVFDIGVGDKTYFIVMEYVDGSDLKALLEHLAHQERRMPLAAALFICCRICDGLAYAHDARDNRGRLLGIVHRDISPPNVLITRHGEVKVVDFGLAKANSQLEHSQPGIIKGKFSYLSPEAALGESVDSRSDIFAAGIILWEMLAGRRLFMGETDLQTVRQVQAAKIPDIKKFNPEVSPDLEAVLMRALARDPRQRYQSARDFCIDLNNLLFRAAQPVSAFDVAKLVGEVAEERDRRKSRQRQSIIGSMIEDAMMEFTSLDPDQRHRSFRTLHSTTSSLASQPLDVLGGGQEWAGSLGLERPSATAELTGSFAVGNLAALEDDGNYQPSLPPIGRPPGVPSFQPRTGPSSLIPSAAPGPFPGRTPMPSSGPGQPPAGSSPSAARAVPNATPSQAPSVSVGSLPSAAASSLTKAAKPVSSSTLAIVVVLVLAAGAAGAFLSGAIQ